jgi:tRNA(Ile)-lysidine synthase
MVTLKSEMKFHFSFLLVCCMAAHVCFDISYFALLRRTLTTNGEVIFLHQEFKFMTAQTPHPLFTRIQLFSQKHRLFQPASTIIVGLSGGPDSVFLLHFLVHLQKEHNLNIIAAHLDHGWRPESAHDVTFCKKVAAELGVTFLHAHAGDLNLQIPYNGSKEEVGRKLRRHFFEHLARQHNATGIALAHHADDQQETFFIRLMRGATLTGLTGMKPKDGLYIRPLLELHKQEILEYLHISGIEYIIDSTNNAPAFLRNRIRAQVLPALKATDDRFEQNFKSTVDKLQQTEHFLENLTTTMLEQIKVPHANQAVLDLTKWRALDDLLQQRVIIQLLCDEQLPFVLSDAFVQEIVRFLASPRGGQHMLNEKWAVVKKSQRAFIQRQ